MPWQTRVPSAQICREPEQRPILHSKPAPQRARQTPEPGHSTAQLPAQVTSQPPEPVQRTLLPSPTATAQGPEP